MSKQTNIIKITPLPVRLLYISTDRWYINSMQTSKRILKFTYTYTENKVKSSKLVTEK